MQTRKLGSTGIEVSRLGIGLSEIRESDVNTVEKLLNTALDQGVNFLDTSACYGNSEELVGKTVFNRRSEFSLATKCGHITGGYDGIAWTADTIKHSIDRSLSRMKTDYIDLVQLNSCDKEVLEQGEVIDELLEAKKSGKTRFVGYSGDNENAEWAVQSGIFDTLQTSFSLVDQKARNGLLKSAQSNGMGIIIKRPIGNGVWGKVSSSSAYTQEYFNRAKAMADLGDIIGSEDPISMAMGFLFSHEEISTAIIGTTNVNYLLSNIQMLEDGVSISPKTLSELADRFENLGSDWYQMN